MRFIDLTGQPFGRLTAQSWEHRRYPNGVVRIVWTYKCVCGNYVKDGVGNVRNGRTKSCGCLHRESGAKVGRLHALPNGAASRNSVLASYKRAAKRRGLAWELDDALFDALTAGDCYYCGVPPANMRQPFSGENGGFSYNGIDRRDCTKGYTFDNVVSCCWPCNRMKGPLSVDEFRERIKRLHDFFVIEVTCV
jgi:hypothetical protein